MDASLRSLLELILHAAILTCNNELCQTVLIYGRLNTFLLSIHNEVVEKALVHFEPGGMQEGDVTLLRILITHFTVLKNCSTTGQQTSR